MASRCRTCGVLSPSEHPTFPLPERLAGMAPFTHSLMEAAAEFEQMGGGTPVEFVAWLDVDIQRAAGLLPRARALQGRPGVRR